MTTIPEIDVTSRALTLGYRLAPRPEITPDPEDETTYKSYLGTPVYSPLEFMRTPGTTSDNSRGVGESTNSNVLLRVDSCSILVDQTKNIVKTSVSGRNGTIKEYISDGDFMLTIQGFIVSEYPLVYPKRDVDMLIQLLQLQKQIPVASEFLMRFQIDTIVVESFRIGEKVGSRNEVPFEIYASSDFNDDILIDSPR